MADDLHTDGSPAEVDLALRHAWREVSAVRWHDADGAYLLADLTGCVDGDGVVHAHLVRRAAVAVAQQHRYLVDTSAAYRSPDADRPVGSSGGNVGAARRRLAPVWNPTDAALAQHRARPAHGTGGGRIPKDYVSPR